MFHLKNYCKKYLLAHTDFRTDALQSKKNKVTKQYLRCDYISREEFKLWLSVCVQKIFGREPMEMLTAYLGWWDYTFSFYQHFLIFLSLVCIICIIQGMKTNSNKQITPEEHGVCLSAPQRRLGGLTVKLGHVASSLTKARHWPADCPVCAAPARSAQKTGARRHTCKQCWWCTVTAKGSESNVEQHNSFTGSASPPLTQPLCINGKGTQPS